MRRHWRWVLVGILLLGAVAIFYVDRRAPEALTRRGIALVNSKDYRQAINSFDRAIEIDPKYAPAYHGRGLAYLNQGDRDQAIVDFGEAIRLVPSDARARYHRGVA